MKIKKKKLLIPDFYQYRLFITAVLSTQCVLSEPFGFLTGLRNPYILNFRPWNNYYICYLYVVISQCTFNMDAIDFSDEKRKTFQLKYPNANFYSQIEHKQNANRAHPGPQHWARVKLKARTCGKDEKR